MPRKKKATEGSQAEVSFEEALAGLEKVVAAMEAGDLTLDQSLAGFAEGIAYSRLCLAKLDQAEREIDLILQDEQGILTEKPLTLEGDL